MVRFKDLKNRFTELFDPDTGFYVRSGVIDENGNDTIEVRQILPLTIAFDHKALDYGDVLPFMNKLDEIFENPSIIHSWKE